jgi:undecaprenyl-diphosphatase
MRFAALARLELPAIRRVNRANRLRPLSLLFGAVSRLGDGLAWYLLMAALPLVYGSQELRLSLAMLGCGAAATLVYKLIKLGTRRPRPCAEPGDLTLTVAPLDVFSFPSGHTLHAVAFTVLSGWFHSELLWVTLPFTGLVAASRVILGLHYPSDVLAGAALGTGVAMLTISVL